MENTHKKNTKKKQILAASTLIVVIAFLIGMLSGALYYREALFPIPQLGKIVHDYKLRQNPEQGCPVGVSIELKDLRAISKFNQIDKIFWGDSLVEFVQDGRFYGIQNYRIIGKSGQLVYCSLQEIDYILNFKPDTVIIYVGGNDADGQSWYGPEEAGAYYEEIIDTLLSNNIKPIIHLIHGSASSRNKDYREKYNNILESIGKRKNILVIPDAPEFSYNKTWGEIRREGSLYSYDGEHLKPEGYKLWISHIRQYVPDFE